MGFQFGGFMRTILVLAFAAALSIAAVATAGDPFDDARHAIAIKDNGSAERLIDSGQFDVNMQNHEGYTLLHFAAGDGNLAMVNALLQRGADPRIKNSLGMTALDRAVGTMVSARLRQAMSAPAARPGANPAAGGGGGGDFDKARYAIGTRDNAAVLAELDKGLDVRMANSEGNTLLHYAAGEGNLAMVEELLRRGADVNAANDVKFRPLDRAIGTAVAARIRAAGGTSGIASLTVKPVTMTPPKPAGAPSSPPSAKSPNEKMCASRHYSSSALCSDSTCKMREYRKWQTCLKTGSYY